MEHKHVTHVIITGGSTIDLAECLLSLRETTHPAVDTLVVDNCDRRRGLGEDFARAFPEARILPTPARLTFAEAANFGMADAFGRGAQLVFLLNDDVTVHPDALLKLTRAEGEMRPGLFAPEVWPYDSGLERTRYRFDWKKRLLVRERAEESTCELVEIDYAEGSAILISAEVIEAAGGFDEDFGFYYEDADLSLRAREAGFAVCEVPGARVWHKVGASTGRGLSAFKAYYRARNTLKFAKKHRHRAAPVRNAAYHFGGFLIPRGIEALFKAACGSRESARVFRALVRGTLDHFIGANRPFAPPEPSEPG